MRIRGKHGGWDMLEEEMGMRAECTMAGSVKSKKGKVQEVMERVYQRELGEL